jgi:hypothetical protein
MSYSIGWFRNPANDKVDAFRVDRLGPDGEWTITPYDCVGGKRIGFTQPLTMSTWKWLVPLMEMK